MSINFMMAVMISEAEIVLFEFGSSKSMQSATTPDFTCPFYNYQIKNSYFM